MKKLFDPVQSAHDPKNRPVFICKDEEDKFYVYKPQSGFKSRSFDTADDEALLAIFERVRHDGQTFATYLPGDLEAVEEKAKLNTEETIKLIAAATSVDEVKKLIEGDDRKGVNKAAEAKITELQTPDA